MKRWGEHKSVWYRELKKRPFEILRQDLITDTVVVGGGITGMVAATLLAEQGHRVVVVTDGEIGQGTTGHSTGHLTQVLDEDYSVLVNDFGQDAAQKVIDSVTDSINLIEELSRKYGIECGFERVPGFKYAEETANAGKLEKEVEEARKLGLQVSYMNVNPLPFTVARVARFENQAQFDPLRFVTGLAENLPKLGGAVFEGTRVRKIDDGERVKLETEFGSVTARDAVLATHTPVGLYISLHTRVAPYFSYVMGVRLKNVPADGLYWDMHDPYFYLRPYRHGENLWIVGGRDHKTGQERAPMEKYLELEEYLTSHFDVESIEFYWGNELYESVDGLPYIGKIPFTDSLYTGTGYAGTGLTWGTAAARIISDQILGRANPWAEVYDPMRVKPIASASSFIKENVNVARQFIGDKLTHKDISAIRAIPPDNGQVVEVGGKKVAIYKDEKNNVVAMSPTCTHMSCTVHWNSAEKTWDCPCHGGRYRCTGEVFAGPPLKDMQLVSLTAEKAAAEEVREPIFIPGLSGIGDQLGLT